MIKVSICTRGGMSTRHHEQGARLRDSAVLKYCIFTMKTIMFKGGQEIRERERDTQVYSWNHYLAEKEVWKVDS